MSSHRILPTLENLRQSAVVSFLSLAGFLLLGGCASDPNRISATNPLHPGPASGRAAGAVAGVGAGNAVGAVVGVGEGFAAGASAPFHKTTRVVRSWRTETTTDGRTIRVPVDTVVDEHGRPLNAPVAPVARQAQ